ncbi:hypothetical protein F5X96DRAFT_429101 [Biscogniauxia mediterranea]|nr:hypothetical protein F5X96DRAFT_429101 [Biscogniauxia mediterranea]
MEYSPPRFAIRTLAERLSLDKDKMSTLTMPSPHHHHLGFHRELSWLGARTEPTRRQLHDQERVALPSIRQAFPELQLQAQQDNTARTSPATTSPISGLFTGTTTPPDYIHSPSQHKRRRQSIEGERDERASQVPRLYSNPQRAASQQRSPPSRLRTAPEPWGASSRKSPYTGNSSHSSMKSPVSAEVHERVEARPTLPSLPMLNFERGGPEMRPIRSHSGDDYIQEPIRRPSLAPSSSHGMETGALGYHRQASFSYGFHPNRVQSLSVGSVHPFDRTPFSPGAYGHQYPDTFMRMGELNMSVNGDGKQRKRRGNLPKETTDKLRAWFVAHLHHPYPTEDEKQDLMRQTGLQMNQISNWFINARRRQLPTMINNARAESDAMTSRGGDSKALPSTERLEYDHEGKLSDGEGTNYDDVEVEPVKRRRATSMKRGSI